MALIECAGCGKRIEARCAVPCAECAAPLCPDCEREGRGRCGACRENDSKTPRAQTAPPIPIFRFGGAICSM